MYAFAVTDIQLVYENSIGTAPYVLSGPLISSCEQAKPASMLQNCARCRGKLYAAGSLLDMSCTICISNCTASSICYLICSLRHSASLSFKVVC